MATKGATTNTRLVLIGALVLLLGIVLVLLILRGSVGDGDATGADTTAASQRDETEAEEPAAPAASDLVSEGEAETARIALPLDLADGQEAVTVRAAFDRAAAALPVAGDRVVVYRVAAEEGDGESEDEDADAEDADAEAEPADAEAQRLLEEVEVLGVIGPRPAANEGTVTVALAVEADDVARLLPVARDEAVWLTVLPGEDDEDAGTGAGADEDADDGQEGSS